MVGGGTNDLVIVTGALTLDGTLTIADAGGFSRGVYRLFNYGGALTDNSLVIAGPPARFVAGDMLISTATAGQVNLIVSSGGFGLQFWDGAGTVGDGVASRRLRAFCQMFSSPLRRCRTVMLPSG